MVNHPISAQAVGTLLSTTKELATPVLSDLVGIAGGDWLHHVRIRSASRLEARTKEILKQRGIEDHFEEISPAILKPLTNAASDETREELLDLWARLLAAAADPKRTNAVRKSFVSILQQFDPPDALVFRILWELGGTSIPEGRARAIGQKLGSDDDAVQVSFENLFRLKCVLNQHGGPDIGNTPVLSATGRELARALFL